MESGREGGGGRERYPQEGGGVEGCMPNITHANTEEKKNFL